MICQLTGGLLQELFGQERFGYFYRILARPACDDALHNLIIRLGADCQRQLLQLRVNQPAVVEADSEEVEDDTLRSVFKILDSSKPVKSTLSNS